MIFVKLRMEQINRRHRIPAIRDGISIAVTLIVKPIAAFFTDVPGAGAAGSHFLHEFFLGKIGRLQGIVAGKNGDVLALVQHAGSSLRIDGEIQFFQMKAVIQHRGSVPTHENNFLYLRKQGVIQQIGTVQIG